MGLIDRIDAATPDDRDRYVDAVRVVSILLVVLGHWIVRVVTGTEGELEPGYLLQAVPATQWATLLVQVMPLFFLLGGAVNAESWRRARDRGESASDWLALRSRRLLRPALPLIAILVTAACLMANLWPEYTLLFDFRVAVFPLWFLAAYLLVTAVTPFTLAWHERHGSGLLLGVCAMLALVVDGLRFTVGADGPWLGTQPAVAAVNVIVVWLAIHQLGFVWADDGLPSNGRSQARLILLGAALLVVMIGFGPYPLTMVPIEGSHAANNAGPPTAALLALTMVQIGVVLALRRSVTAWLQRPAVWAPVALIGAGLMSVYLWHQPVMVLVANLTYPLGFWPVTETVDLRWWLWRLPWVLLCGVVLVLVVVLLQRFESPRQAPAASAGRSPVLRRVAGLLLFCIGIAGFIDTGLVQEGWPLQLPWLPLLAFLAGLWGLGALGRAGRTGD
ncbi:MAG: acyltransferase [Gammaproteobacteria bacterium]|nr:acyltransferase [Gammaproteobacteria bacterium]